MRLRKINYFRRSTKSKESQMFKIENVAEANRMDKVDHKACGLAVQMLRNTTLTHKDIFKYKVLELFCSSEHPFHLGSSCGYDSNGVLKSKKMMMVSSGALISSSPTKMLVNLVTAAGVADGDVRVISDTPEK